MLGRYLFILFFLFAGVFCQAQRTNLSVGAYAGIPIGNSSPYYTFQAGVDAIYLTDVSRTFKFGFATGFSYAAGDHYYRDHGDVEEEFQTGNFAYVPLAASGRFILGDFFVGADVGYAVSVTGKKAFNPNGGFYFRPKVGYDFEIFNLFISSSNIFVRQPDATDYLTSRHGLGFFSVNAGIEYKF